MGHRRAMSVAVVVAVMGIGIGGGAAAGGVAGQEWLTCHMSGRVHLDPGLREVPQAHDLRVEADLGSCVGSDPGVVSGVLTATGSGSDLTCLNNAPFSGSALIVWNTGATSEMDFVTKGVGPAGAVLGTVTGGTAFVGTMFTGPVAFMGDITACRTPGGLTQADFEERSSLS